MSVCSATADITNPTNELKATFANSVLPADGAGRENGRLDKTALETVYGNLVTAGRLLSHTQYQSILGAIKDGSRQSASDAIQQYQSTETTTMQQIKDEFCFYYVRYKYALQDLFTTLTNLSTAGAVTTLQQGDLQTKLNTAIKFNDNLNDLIQITNYIAQQRSTEMREQNLDINSMNSDIQSTFSVLQDHNNMLKQKDALAKLRQRMAEFTQEKNLSASNLLSLYGFLNLVALGLLFYIYRT